jgi:hypothetical protein
MADKYESKWQESGAVEIVIPSGPAKGQYSIHPVIDAEGNIYLGQSIEVKPGKFAALKIRASENPSLAAEITRRAEAAKLAAESAEISNQEIIDRQMREAGLESAGNAGEAYNRLRPVRGNNF